jgi:hypothetical protein
MICFCFVWSLAEPPRLQRSDRRGPDPALGQPAVARDPANRVGLCTHFGPGCSHPLEVRRRRPTVSPLKEPQSQPNPSHFRNLESAELLSGVFSFDTGG